MGRIKEGEATISVDGGPEVNFAQSQRAIRGDNQLRSFLERLKNAEQERRDRAEDVKEIFAEVKSAGYNVKALRTILKRELETAEQSDKRRSTEENIELMMTALGAFADAPLAVAAIERAAAQA